jgi:hypothetical protein
VAIAKELGVGTETVRRARSELPTSPNEEDEKRVGLDLRLINHQSLTTRRWNAYLKRFHQQKLA